MNSPPSTARSISTRSGRNGLAYPNRETPCSSVRCEVVINCPALIHSMYTTAKPAHHARSGFRRHPTIPLESLRRNRRQHQPPPPRQSALPRRTRRVLLLLRRHAPQSRPPFLL